jgi:hypothetical protein
MVAVLTASPLYFIRVEKQASTKNLVARLCRIQATGCPYGIILGMGSLRAIRTRQTRIDLGPGTVAVSRWPSAGTGKIVFCVALVNSLIS